MQVFDILLITDKIAVLKRYEVRKHLLNLSLPHLMRAFRDLKTLNQSTCQGVLKA